MIVVGLARVELPRDEVFDCVLRALGKVNAKTMQVDRTYYRIEGKSATTTTGFTFPLKYY